MQLLSVDRHRLSKSMSLHHLNIIESNDAEVIVSGVLIMYDEPLYNRTVSNSLYT